MPQSVPFTVLLADCVRDIAEAPIPPAVTAAAKLCLLDFTASVLAADASDEAAAAEALLPFFGTGDCSLIARPQRAAVCGAAFFHGLLATVADVDDAHRFASGLHLSATTLPAALALGEQSGCSGDRFLRAVAAGYEISSRLGRAVEGGLRGRGFHATGAVGPFGAGAAASVMLGLDRAQTAHALGIAASGAGGTFAFLSEGASSRHTHAAWASTNGLTAALMAKQGMTGPTLALEGQDGFLSAYAGAFDASYICAVPPSQSGAYEIHNTYRKLFTACGHSLPAITAALELRDRVLPRIEEVERIEVRGYPAAARLTNRDPGSVGEAKFSMPCIVALALLFGNVTDREMRMAVLARPEVRRLAAKVVVVEDPKISADFPRLRASEIRIELKDGTRFSKYADAAIGLPENPASEEQIAQKFIDNAQGSLAPDAISSFITRLPSDLSVRDIMRIVRTCST